MKVTDASYDPHSRWPLGLGVVLLQEARDLLSDATPREASQKDWYVPDGRRQGNSRLTRVSLIRAMPKHIDHDAAGVAYEEPTHTPRLIRQWVDDVVPPAEGFGVDGVDVHDFNAHLGALAS